MKFFAILSLFVMVVFINLSCNTLGRQDNLKKLPEVTCVIYCQVLFELDMGAQRAYIDAAGRITTDINAAVPFFSQGTGALMSNNFIGTVKHIHHLSFSEMYNSDEVFRTNLTQNLDAVGLAIVSPDDNQVRPFLVSAWCAFPETPKLPIETSVKKDPYKVPDGCLGLELYGMGRADVDLAIYKISDPSKLKIAQKGYGPDDLADEAAIKNIKLGDAIETSGYPAGLIQKQIDFVRPQPAEAKITALPSASVRLLQTNLDSNFGGSGSFVIDKNTGLVIGILTGGDPTNRANVVCVPANELRNMLEEQLKNPNLK